MTIGSFLGVLLVLGCAAAAAAEPPEQGFEVGLTAGFVLLDGDLAGPDGPNTEPVIGARGAYVVSKDWAWFLDARHADFNTDTFRNGATMLDAHTGADIMFGRNPKMRWFASAGIGYLDLTFDTASDYYSFLAVAGVGQRVWLSGRNHIRWELRAEHSLASDGLLSQDETRGEDITQAQFLISFNWGLGGGKARRARDGDGDGVSDRRDRCAGTPPGTAVDRRGCPIEGEVAAAAPVVPVAPEDLTDTDGDGVPDSADRCPNTLHGIEVDETGCFVDRDDDGVYDGLGMDKCPGTPRGARVDAHGCPFDSDGDGVYDGLDACSDTPPGTAVDALGCPAEGGGR